MAALVTGGQVIEVTVDAEREVGNCHVRERRPGNAIMRLAGYVAENRARGEPLLWVPTRDEFTAGLRHHDIADAARIIGMDALPAAWVEAIHLVDEQWENIAYLAGALATARRLSGDDINELLANLAG